MDYIRIDADGQLTFTQSTDFLTIPSFLYGFVNESTSTGTSASGRTVIRFSGSLQADNEELIPERCFIYQDSVCMPRMRQYPDAEYLL